MKKKNKNEFKNIHIEGLKKQNYFISKPINNNLAVDFTINQWYPSTTDEKVLKRRLTKVLWGNGNLNGFIVSVDAPENRSGNTVFIKSNVCLYLKESLGDDELINMFEGMYCEL